MRKRGAVVGLVSVLALGGTTALATAIAVLRAGAGSAPVVRAATPAQQGQWSSVMSWPIVAIHSTLLHNGKVLPWDVSVGTTQPQIYDPATHAFSPTGTLATQIFCSGQVQLNDGRLMVIGGSVSNQVGTKAAYIYDPVANSWTRTPDMHFARWYPDVVKLPDGRVLALSGQISKAAYANTPEIYDPVANTWSILNVNTSGIHEPNYPFGYVMPDGRVFVYGPRHGKSYILDISKLTFTAGPSSPEPASSMVMYEPGQLMVSGNGAKNGPAGPGTAIIDLTAAKPAWKVISSMAFGRYNHNLTPLADGSVLAVGGSNIISENVVAKNSVLPAELWNPTTQTWATMASLTDPRMYHSTSILLPDGTVLSTGGGHLNADPDYFSAQIFTPPYLFTGGARPTITSAPSSAGYGAGVAVQTPDAATITKVSLVSLAAETHTVDMDQRYVSLNFSQSTGGITVTTPANANLAPPGYYMLFIVNSSGDPSVASMIKIG